MFLEPDFKHMAEKPLKRLEKWHSIGNDFLITQDTFTPQEIALISDRKFGMGCDQFIIQNHMFLSIFNADGSAAGMCGNALKCLAIKHFRETGAKQFTFMILDQKVAVNMENEVPWIFFPPFFNFRKEEQKNIKVKNSLESHIFYQALASSESQFFYLEVINPHLICIFNSFDLDLLNIYFSAPEITEIIKEVGLQLQIQYSGTKGVNVSFVIKGEDSALFIRTFERGTGETLSCGSAAVAAAICTREEGSYINHVKVKSFGSQKFNEFAYVDFNKEKIALIGKGIKVGDIILSNL